jgi:hypothetical protein
VKLLTYLDQVPILGLLVAALLLGLAPFQPQPHLLEKLNMLLAGELTGLLDIFDLVFHGAPSLLLIIRLLRKATNDSAAL